MMGMCFGWPNPSMMQRLRAKQKLQDNDEKQACGIGDLFRTQNMKRPYYDHGRGEIANVDHKLNDRLCVVEQHFRAGFVGVRFFDESLNGETPRSILSTNLKRTTVDQEIRFFTDFCSDEMEAAIRKLQRTTSNP